MDTNTFNEIIEAQLERSRSLLFKKNDSYATEDRLHGFKTSAELQGINPAQALRGMLAKHTVSVFDMINAGKFYPQEVWDEKITDSINYHLLLRALVEEPGGTYKPVYDVNSTHPGQEYHELDDQIGVEAAEALWKKVATNVEDYSATQFEPPIRIRRTEEMEHRPRVISRMRANLERPLEPWEEDLLNGGQETQTNGEGEDQQTANDTQTLDAIVRVFKIWQYSPEEHRKLFELINAARPDAFPDEQEPTVEEQVADTIKHTWSDLDLNEATRRIIRAVKGE